MLSAALRSQSSPSLGLGAIGQAASPLSVLSASTGALYTAEVDENLEDDLLFAEEERRGSPAGASGDESAAQRSGQRRIQFQPHPKQQQQHLQLSATLPPTSAWDVPAARAASAGAGGGGGGGGGTAGMARSMPRPISGARLARLAAGGEDSDDEEPFVPPHLAASMAEPQLQMSHSMSTKGPAALRLRSMMLRQTGYLDGNLGMAAATMVHVPSP